jgi:hypothetical protein
MRRTPLALLPLATVLALLGAVPASAQDPVPRTGSRGELRVGVTLGGTGLVGFVTEYRRGMWGGELNVGTITFREVALAVSGKRYFSGGRIQPAAGLGLWSLTAWTADGSGSVLIVRAPLAVEWSVTGGHAMGIEVGMNRAIAVNRLDPEDDTPPNTNIVPLPGLYYRYGFHP